MSDVAEAAAGTREPDARELAFMQGRGWLLVRGFFGAAEVRDMLRWTEQLAQAPEAPGRHWVYHEASVADPGARLIQRIENFCPFHERFDELVRGGALARWSAALMGGPVTLFKDKINFKMPGAPGFKAHQDQQAGWSRYAPLFLTAMVAMDDATERNGCLEIAAGRRLDGLIGEEWTPLDEAALDLRPAPAEPGDVIFFDSFVPHASKDNLTAEPRRILYLTYNLAQAGDHRQRYYADKRASFPPDVERRDDVSYVFRV